MYTAADLNAFIEYNQRMVRTFLEDIQYLQKNKPMCWQRRIKCRRKWVKQHQRIISNLSEQLSIINTTSKTPA